MSTGASILTLTEPAVLVEYPGVASKATLTGLAPAVEFPFDASMTTLTGAAVLGELPDEVSTRTLTRLLVPVVVTRVGFIKTLIGVAVAGESPLCASTATLTGIAVLGEVPRGESMSTLILLAVRLFTSPVNGLLTKTTVLTSPELTVATPDCTALTAKLAEPLTGMVTDWGTVATEGLFELRVIVSGVVNAGESETVMVPVPPGTKASWPGLKVSLDDDKLTPICAVLGEPFLVVTMIASAPGDKAVISAVIRISSMIVTLFIATSPPLEVIVSVSRRFCPVIVTSIFEPTKRTLGLMPLITGDAFAVVPLVTERRLPSSS